MAENNQQDRLKEIVESIERGIQELFEIVRGGHFKIIRIGSAIRISKKSFDEWLDSQES